MASVKETMGWTKDKTYTYHTSPPLAPYRPLCRPRRDMSLFVVSKVGLGGARPCVGASWTILPLRSVETPVAKSPLEATASEPPRSTIHASVPPCRMLRRFYTSSARPREAIEMSANRMLLVDVELEIDDARSSGRNSELVHGQSSLAMDPPVSPVKAHRFWVRFSRRTYAVDKSVVEVSIGSAAGELEFACRQWVPWLQSRVCPERFPHGSHER